MLRTDTGEKRATPGRLIHAMTNAAPSGLTWINIRLSGARNNRPVSTPHRNSARKRCRSNPPLQRRFDFFK
ncbi:hypothetical protein [Burkholderia ubonensis]|uniref:hypothetical protein n=1 Tax=Burkholderia ubonensis TaxID=101571 RepID=UPI00105629AD|nr:hypothetical protein [Burkholderia ubonensis]